MTAQSPRLGVALMVLTTAIFAVQDGISRHLAAEYNVLMVVMIRYWFFALFVIAVAAAEVGVGLAMVLLLYRNRRSIDLTQIDQLRG